MSPNFRIAIRFLTAKKRSMLMSLSCIVLGVGLFIVTSAATEGFEGYFIDTILGSDGAIVIADKIQNTQPTMEAGSGTGFRVRLEGEGVEYREGIDEPDNLRRALEQYPAVIGISAILRDSAEFLSASRTDSGRVFGINLDEHVLVTALGRQIVAGSLDAYRTQPYSAIVGSELARRLQLGVGDSLQIRAKGQLRRFFVRAIFSTGVTDIDRDRVYVSLSDARSLLQKPLGGVTLFQVQVRDPNQAPELAERFRDNLQYYAQPWQVREESWLSAFGALRISSALTVSVFTVIAGLAMFSTLAMIVLEKTKDIAILRSMGYERADITRIFLWQAVVVLLIGSLLGATFGALGTWIVSRIPIRITGIFATDTFIVAWSGWHYVQAIATAVVMVMLASIIPARRAARLEPGDIVRGTAQ